MTTLSKLALLDFQVRNESGFFNQTAKPSAFFGILYSAIRKSEKALLGIFYSEDQWIK